GGSVHGTVSEAELLAGHARQLGYRGELVTAPGGRSTWETITNVLPYLEDAGRIRIVSNSLHAEKARAYLRHLRPDLAERLVKADDYRFGELILLKPIMAALGAWSLRRLPVTLAEAKPPTRRSTVPRWRSTTARAVRPPCRAPPRCHEASGRPGCSGRNACWMWSDLRGVRGPSTERGRRLPRGHVVGFHRT